MAVEAPDTTVSVGPSLDVRTVEAERRYLQSAADAAAGDVLVDMSRLESIDAAGLGMLTALHLRLERCGQRLVLCNCPRELRRVLAMTRLNRVLWLDRGRAA